MTAVRALLVLLVFLVLVAPAAAASPVRATLRASSTMPAANTPWRYEITVKDRQGRAVKATARLQILRGDVVVSCWKRRAMRPCKGANAGMLIPFTGKRSGAVKWAARWVGSTLTFQATVFTNGRSLRLRIPVRVQAP